MPPTENVLVIPAERLSAAGDFTGFRPFDPAYRDLLLDSAHFRFRPRDEVETDPSLKQLIPYVVLRHDGRLFHYTRSSGGEKRLLGRRSVGIGGHINDTDAAGEDAYTAGMRRELAEEVDIAGAWREHELGFIYDPSTFVGSVHLGVVHLFELDSPDVSPREDGIAEAGFAPLAELTASRGEFETWSQLVFDALTGT